MSGPVDFALQGQFDTTLEAELEVVPSVVELRGGDPVISERLRA